ncbi:Hypothetical predicted protein [Pelobates cultripes]|uniref:Reverse transcriptase n=1 Tax=Pelobates cultripes TaxID=61616 RepID=A0AAD1SEH6_PELCU|nr:Hypothetical predicted protein [Pelobates cultripes]
MRQPGKGGVGFPNLKAYYHATQIANILHMHSTTYTPQWIPIETSCGGITDLTAAMWTPKKLHHTPRSTLPTTKLLYNIWDNHRAAFCSVRPWSMATPLKTIALYNNTFPYRAWQACNLTHLHQICTEQGPLPLSTLQSTYNIPTQLTFSYWQLKALLVSTTGNEPSPQFDSTLTPFEKMCLHLIPTQKTLSVCYRHNNAHKPEPEWQIKKDWHRDIASILLAKQGKSSQISSMAEVVAMVAATLDYEVILWNQTKMGKWSATAKAIWATYTAKRDLQAVARDNASDGTET